MLDIRRFTTRRRLLKTATITVAGLASTRPRTFGAPATKSREIKVISPDAQYYHGWPTIARRNNGQLLVVCSGGREQHVCPFGRVDLMTSDDDGATWSWPRTLLDSASDDRDASVLETIEGSLLVTSFTSLAYVPILEKAEKEKLATAAWPAERLAAWQAAHRRLNDKDRSADLGQWLIRSTDGGLTWSPRVRTLVNSPHGPTQLADGRLLYVGKELWSKPHRIGVSESTDDGQTWKWLAEIPARKGDDPAEYHELYAVEAADGRIVAQIRNENKTNFGETLQTESTDGGKTWSVPHAIGVWGLPSHLLRLRNGHLLMTYGHRRPPFGNQARLSIDHGRTWSAPLNVSDDGAVGDLGYPSTVELQDGSLLTVWYERMHSSPKAVLRQSRWEL